MDRRDILKALLASPLAAYAAPPRDAAGVQALQRDWKTLLAQGADVTLTTEPLQRPNEEWKKILTPQQYNVLREEGTERPGSSPLNGEKRPGVFVCAGCSLPLFTSAMKYDSGTGWPSFFTLIPGVFGTKTDRIAHLPAHRVPLRPLRRPSRPPLRRRPASRPACATATTASRCASFRRPARRDRDRPSGNDGPAGPRQLPARARVRRRRGGPAGRRLRRRRGDRRQRGAERHLSAHDERRRRRLLADLRRIEERGPLPRRRRPRRRERDDRRVPRSRPERDSVSGRAAGTLTVPGGVASWCEAHAAYGRLPLARNLEAAIGYARDGFPVTARVAQQIESAAADRTSSTPKRARSSLPAGTPPRRDQAREPGSRAHARAHRRRRPRRFLRRGDRPRARALRPGHGRVLRRGGPARAGRARGRSRYRRRTAA